MQTGSCSTLPRNECRERKASKQLLQARLRFTLSGEQRVHTIFPLWSRQHATCQVSALGSTARVHEPTHHWWQWCRCLNTENRALQTEHEGASAYGTITGAMRSACSLVSPVLRLCKPRACSTRKSCARTMTCKIADVLLQVSHPGISLSRSSTLHKERLVSALHFEAVLHVCLVHGTAKTFGAMSTTRTLVWLSQPHAPDKAVLKRNHSRR